MFGHFVPGVNGVEPVEGSGRIGRTGGIGFDGVIFVARSRPGPLVFFWSHCVGFCCPGEAIYEM